MDNDHIVLPVSALKTEVTRLFDALEAGRTVYVSKHGDVVAAFRPFDRVPQAVAAAYVTPGAKTAEISARDIGQAVPSKAVSDAAKGLPSLVTRNHEIFGVLTPASVPTPAVVPDLDRAAARSEAVREFLAENPEASLEEITAIRTELDRSLSEALLSSTGDDGQEPPIRWSVDEATEELDHWTEQGSSVEAVVQELLERVTPVATRIHWRRPQTLPLATLVATYEQEVSVWRANALVSIRPTVGTMEGMREGARLMRDDPIRARTHFVGLLAGAAALNSGVMWRLGDLARDQGHVAEARAWYGIALSLPDTGSVAEATPAVITASD